MLTADPLNTSSKIVHGFFTRQGGHSTDLFDSLNCGPGSGDDPTVVKRNRTLCADRLGVTESNLLTVSQHHTATVVTVSEIWDTGTAPVADAMVTRTPGIALGILTADCAPVLLADPANGIIGAAHAGWKGALAGVIDNTVSAMVSLGAALETLTAVVGPSIGKDSYEVGPEFHERFVTEDNSNTAYFSTAATDGKHVFDLQAYVADRLKRSGIESVSCVAADTCTDEDRFFSYRRSCLRGEPKYGRQLSGIALVS